MSKHPQGPASPESGPREFGTEQTRFIRIHQVLLEAQRDKRRKYPTWKELAEAVSEPLTNVKRAVERMRDQWNMPIDRCPERGGGIGYTEPVTHFPLLIISQRQAAVLGLVQQLVSQLEGTPMYDDFMDVLRKAFASLPGNFTEVFQQFREAVSFHTIGLAAPAAPDWDVFSTCIRAVIDHGELEIEHCSAKPGAMPKKVVVRPRHLANINHAWYLFADAPGGEPDEPAWKYALTRIGKAVRTDKLFKPERPFDIDAEIATGLGAHNDRKTVDVHVQFSAEVAPFILERKWHHTQTTHENADGSLEVRMKVCMAPELSSLLLPWAGNMRVIGPDPLRERMRAFGEALVRDHS